MFNLKNPSWAAYCQSPDSHPLEDLAKLATDSSRDEITPSMTAAATVLSLAQTGGPSMLAHPPGYLLVNAGSLASDPIDSVVKQLTGLSGPQPTGDGASFARNRNWMIHQINEVVRMRRERKLTEEFLAPRVAEFRQSRALAFGGDRVGYYARRRDTELGWVSDATNHLTLRLDSDDDRAAFGEHVRTGAPWITHPAGYGDSLQEERKRLSVAGSLPVGQLDDGIVSGVIKHTLSILFLPHATTAPLKVPDLTSLRMLAVGLETEAGQFRHRPAAIRRLPDSNWWQAWSMRLRLRLLWFPEDYDFFVRRTIKELDGWCGRLASIVAMGGPLTPQPIAALYEDLHALTFHGLCLGIEWLGWHGYGFYGGGRQNEVARLLAAVRSAEGPVSRRDIQRKLQWLSADKRDAMLEILQDEGLVNLSDKQVTAVPAADYLQGIHTRTGLKPPKIKWDGVRKQEAAMASTFKADSAG